LPESFLVSMAVWAVVEEEKPFGCSDLFDQINGSLAGGLTSDKTWFRVYGVIKIVVSRPCPVQYHR
jgi:hypothetical protein